MLSRNQIRQAALQYLYAASQTPETEREGIWDILMEPFRGDYCKLKAKAVSGHLTRDYPDKMRLFITRARETADKLQQDPLTLPVRDQLQDLLAKEGEFNASLLRLKKALHEDPSNDRGSLSAACDAAQGLNTALMQMRRRLLQLPYYTQLAKKSKVSGPEFALIFCFAQILQIHSCIFSLLYRISSAACAARPAKAGLRAPRSGRLFTAGRSFGGRGRPSPDPVLAFGLLDPTQLVGDDQLFQVVDLFPQDLALVHVLDQDAAVLLLQDVFAGDDIDVFGDGLFGADKGLVGPQGHVPAGIGQGVAGDAGGGLIGPAEAAVDDDDLAPGLHRALPL